MLHKEESQDTGQSVTNMRAGGVYRVNYLGRLVVRVDT